MTRKLQTARRRLFTSSSSSTEFRVEVAGARAYVFRGDRRVGHGLLDGDAVGRLVFTTPLGAEARRVLEDRLLRAARR